MSKIGFAGGVIAGLSASDIHAAILSQRQAARKYPPNYYGTTFAIFWVLRNYVTYKTITYKILLSEDARQMLNMG